ncbi:type II 3-dehydroquinate dehydratase [Epulopiscium sp. SCG-B10WGA-EpuloA2]|nr:type II 3-dehydroquinate dehydratase [Epulopiscium sp. SCG-B10WGA-EpuloA2]
MKICVINGPSLNFLGIREPHIYGHETLADVENNLQAFADKNNIEISFFQSNCEGAIIDHFQQCYHDKVDGIIINPGAYSHTSYAIADAIKSISIDVVEVHISNIYTRESFRSHSVTANSANGVITGLGTKGYELALQYFLQ